MISNALLVASLFVFIFSILDLFLSDHQKKRIDILTTHLWSKLDDFKSRSFLNILRSSRFQLILLISGPTLPFLITALLPDPTVKTVYDVNDFLLLSLGVLLPALVAVVLLRWVMLTSGYMIWIRAAVACVILLLVLPFFVSFLVNTTTPPCQHCSAYGQDMLGIAVINLTLLSSAAVLSIIALPLIAVQVVKIFIGVSEFVTRRIAEYPKGSILAGSALATAIVGIFKALS